MPFSKDLYKTLRVKDIREEVPGFKSISFEEGHEINYKAGQYLTFVRFSGDKEIHRSYSITSSPAWNEPLSIGVKRIENGLFSRHLVDTVKPGDELLTIGSGGLFTLPDDIDNCTQIFFFAAGSGITPIYSLIKTLLKEHPAIQVVLIYSNPAEHRALFLDSLRDLQEKHKEHFRIELLFSNNPQLMSARLHRELILHFLHTLAVVPKEQMLFYICGPENYMRLCTYTLREDGIPAGNIKKENFVIDTRPKKNILPPDTATHHVTLQREGNFIDLAVTYPDSILAAAKKAGIALPYSCEAGSCGSCAARCTSGTIWHSYNEVLTDKDLEKGMVLTCVGHPINGDATIVL